MPEQVEALFARITEEQDGRLDGRAGAALAADPDVAKLAGRTMASWHLMERYGFTDRDGRQPHGENFTAELYKD